jgi:hypothetical protein
MEFRTEQAEGVAPAGGWLVYPSYLQYSAVYLQPEVIRNLKQDWPEALV